MKRIFIFCLVLFCLNIKAQDIQYSQFYANALYLSPAFAGANQTSRAILHGRLQWPSLDAKYIGTTFSFDHYFEKYRSGIGILFNQDYLNSADQNRFRNLEVGLQYAYQVDLSENLVFRPGLQMSFAQKSFNQSNLTWGKQFDQNTPTGFNTSLPSGEENKIANPQFLYPDVSAGGLLYSENFWVGISAHHLNTPVQSFMNGNDRLNIKGTLHAGVKIHVAQKDIRRYGWEVDEEETSISPVVLYKMQGKADQLDLGAYFRHNAVVLGAWYRGIPTKALAPERINNEAIIALIGFTHNGFNFGYSYDFTISSLKRAGTGGAHELSLTYNFVIEPSNPKKQRPPSKNRKPVCPKF